VETVRIEDLLSAWSAPVEAISARALAPLDQLCHWLEPLLRDGAVAYLHKGVDFRRELQDATLRWTLDLIEHQSRFGPGLIAEIRRIAKRAK
jgi:16S rRNA (guanine527-N7)-methyltransferase